MGLDSGPFWKPIGRANSTRGQPYCDLEAAGKKSPKINFLGLVTAQWGGGLPHEGVVAERFVPSLESLSALGFEERNLGCPGNFAGTSRTSGEGSKIGRTPRGSYSRKGVFLPSRCLLESLFLEPLLRTLPPRKTHCKTPSKNPS